MLKRPDKIKREQRKSFYLREISKMIMDIAHDEPILLDICPTRVDFSTGDGMCYVYFSSRNDEPGFKKALETLVLYKPSLRKALASITRTRYIPDLKFVYDETIEKSRRVDELLEKAKHEGGN